MELAKFLVQAKINTYASVEQDLNPPLPDSQGEKILLDGSKELEFEEKEFKYRDRYFGSNPFIGEEIVWKGKHKIWGMNYYGLASSKKISTEKIYEFLKKAMLQVVEERPFRGPENFKEGGFEYVDKSHGDINMFHGVEKIFYKGKEVYQLYYHGGHI